MDFSEVYQGLMQGVIDGAENNWPSYETTRHFETARFFSVTGHVMAPEVLVMSARRWRALSDTDKALVRTCARDSVPYMRALWDARVAGARERILASGVEVNEVDNIADFAERMAPVWERFITTPAQRRILEDIRNMVAANA